MTIIKAGVGLSPCLEEATPGIRFGGEEEALVLPILRNVPNLEKLKSLPHSAGEEGEAGGG